MPRAIRVDERFGNLPALSRQRACKVMKQIRADAKAKRLTQNDIILTEIKTAANPRLYKTVYLQRLECL